MKDWEGGMKRIPFGAVEADGVGLRLNNHREGSLCGKTPNGGSIFFTHY